jgi:hypothetical protein
MCSTTLILLLLLVLMLMTAERESALKKPSELGPCYREAKEEEDGVQAHWEAWYCGSHGDR